MSLSEFNGKSNPSQQPKDNEVAIPEHMAIAGLAAHAIQQEVMQPLFFAKEIGEISEKLNGVNKENSALRDKLKTFKKDNAEMNKKIGTLEGKNRKQEETIRALEASQEKLRKELETVEKAKDQLRIEIEEKTSKSSAENKILTEKLDALKMEFDKVENENTELKHSLKELRSSNDALQETVEKLTNSNNCLQETVHSISKDNQKFKVDMSNLEAEQKSIKEKLECKETRLALGQVAWLLEAEIWKVVLPNLKMGLTGILFSMERWLKRNSSKEEGKAAQKRWNDLKQKLHWNEDDHKSALKILKDLRRDDGHPTVDLEVARKQLNEGEYVAETEKKSCEELIDMITTARKLNTKQ